MQDGPPSGYSPSRSYTWGPATVQGDGYKGPPATPNPSGPGNSNNTTDEEREGPPRIVSSYDNDFKDKNNDGNIDDKDVNQWFDEHNLQEEAFKKFVWKLRSDRHYVLAMLVVFGKKSYDIYKTVHGAKSLTKKAGQKSDDVIQQSSRAARRDAMRKSNSPTSRPATEQKVNGDNKQYVTEGPDGKPRVQTNHKADNEHPNNHWHDAEPKVDPATGEILEGNYGEWKYKSGGTSSSYGN